MRDERIDLASVPPPTYTMINKTVVQVAPNDCSPLKDMVDTQAIGL